MDHVGGCDDGVCGGVVLVVDTMTFLDYPERHWRQGRDEWATEHLLDQDDMSAVRAETEHSRITHDGMVSWWALQRADAMAEYNPRDYGWWENDEDDE